MNSTDNHRRLANLHLSRIEPNKGNNPEIAKENDKHLKIARWHIKQAGGE